MARNIEWIGSIEKINGNNRYWISICHITYDHDVLISFKKTNEYVREYFRVHYSWKNAKREMNNLTFGASKTLEETQRLMEKKIKELDEKIK